MMSARTTDDIREVEEEATLRETRGNITDIQAISGPPLLAEEAIRVIKKSGKWIPAIQNVKQVKSYKKQPIVFRLD